jgi:Fic family protein
MRESSTNPLMNEDMLIPAMNSNSLSTPHHLAEVPSQVVARLRRIDLGQGRLDRLAADAPAVADALATRTRIDSVIASNEIEGVRTARRRAERLALAQLQPDNRDEAEIAGYRAALDDVFAHPAEGVTVARLLHWHRELFRHAGPDVAGRLKRDENRVLNPDGTDRFRTMEASRAEGALRALTEDAATALDSDVHHPVLVTAAFTLDLLVIHPFADGNGRTARIATNAMLLQSGYEVGRFVSIEQLLSDRRHAYYETLRRSTIGWHEGTHSVWPWTAYFVELLADAYATMEDRLGRSNPTDQRSLAIEWLRAAAPNSFTMGEARSALAGIPAGTIRACLGSARDAGAIRLEGSGRGARWVMVDRHRLS